MTAINTDFNLALSYLQLLKCLLCHTTADPFGLKIFIVDTIHLKVTSLLWV